MIYITGDFHGEKKRFFSPKIKRLQKNDTLILCGDFGFLWDGGPAEQKLLDWIGRRRYQVLFVEGTHDNLSLLNAYPAQDWCGGLTHVISGKLRHLVRGQRFQIEDKTVLALGGGQPDSGAVYGFTCWQGVLPSKEELVQICDQLDEFGWQADLVVSHQAPTNIEACITQHGSEVNLLTALMNTIQRKNLFGAWCFGSYHRDKVIPPAYHCLYNEVYCAGGVQQGFWNNLKK